MTANQSMNGRKSLASQIDRLDGILDGLADGLNDAVSMLVKEAVSVAVKEAVQSVLTEVLTNPQVLAKMQPKPRVEEPAKPTLRERLSQIWKKVTSGCQKVASACKSSVVKVGKWAGSVVAKAGAIGATLWASRTLVNRFKTPLLIAVGVGTILGLTTYYGGHWFSVLVSGVSGFATTLAVQALFWFRSMLRGLGILGEDRMDWAENAIATS